MRQLRNRAIILTLTAAVLMWVSAPPLDGVAGLAMVLCATAGLVAADRME